MKDIKYYRKIKTETQQELSKLSGELDTLKQARDQLEDDIAEAIDSENIDLVEKLTLKENDIDNRIRAVEKIYARKKEKIIFDKEELIAACNEEMSKYSKDCSAAMEEAKKIKKKYFEKVFEAACIARTAMGIREEYMYFTNKDHAENHTAYKSVHTGFTGILSTEEQSIFRSIDPDALLVVNTTR